MMKLNVSIAMLATTCLTLGLSASADATTAYGTVEHPFSSSSTINIPLSPSPSLGNASLAPYLGSDPATDIYESGYPIFSDVNTATPRYRVACTTPWGCEFDGHMIPIPPDAAPNASSDGAMEIIDPGAGLIYSFWQASRSTSGVWTTSSGSIEAIDGQADTTIDGGPANTGSGMAPLAGVVTTADLASGHIDHALSFSTSRTCATFVDPARSSDGNTPGPSCVPEGARVQLDPSINLTAIPGITPLELMVGRALQQYGAFCNDTGGSSFGLEFQTPTGGHDPYPGLGVPWDYWNMPNIPWSGLRLGAIYANASPANDPIATYYNRLGGSGSYLGSPLDGSHSLAGGEVQDYLGGSIYYSLVTGAHAVRGAILAHYQALGGPAGFLGFPVTDEAGTPDGTGRYSHFSNDGSIYWTPVTGAWSIHGAIRDHWAAMGWERSVLAYPVSDETGTPDGIGRYNLFSNFGSVYWTPVTGAWSIRGAIRAAWASTGWERGPLGYPVSDEYAIPGGRQSTMVSAIMSWDAATGATMIR